MLNMNSPTVQSLFNTGFNPYNGYQPQQQITYNNYNNTDYNYYNTNYGNYNTGMNYNSYSNYDMAYEAQVHYKNTGYYNPYSGQKDLTEAELQDFYYDPMPQHVVNVNHGVNSTLTTNNGYQQSQVNNPYFNPAVFQGYSNPILMKNQEETNRVSQREKAIQQGRIWKRLFGASIKEDDEIDVNSFVSQVESLYYNEPIRKEVPLKDQIIIEKNNHIAQIEARNEWYRQNNIPKPDHRAAKRAAFDSYYVNISKNINQDCDLFEYFTQVYPTLRADELDWQVERYHRDLKNRYNTKDFKKMINTKLDNLEDKSDSFYTKMMESIAKNGVRFTNGDGLTITPDEMEVRVPDRLLKEKQSAYYQQRKHFFDTVFGKKEDLY